MIARSIPRLLSVGVQGHREKECRSLPGLAFHPDAPYVHLDQPLRDAEPQPGAAVFPRDRGVDLTELGEDVLDLVRWDADPGVADAIHEPLAVEPYLDVDSSLGGELEGIAGEVQEALRDSAAVAPSRRDVGLHLRGEREAFLEGQRFQGRLDDGHDLLSQVLFDAELEPSRL